MTRPRPPQTFMEALTSPYRSDRNWLYDLDADDGSVVVGEVVAKADKPESGAIPWLLLRATSHEGSGRLSTVAFIRRANTKGGAAPGKK